MTRCGRGSGHDSPSTLTCCSSIVSSSAAWVRGGVRLSSSTSTTCANTGPGRNSQVPVSGANTDTPGDVGGQEVGMALHARQLGPERERQRAGQDGLAHAGHVFDEQVTARQRRHGRGGQSARGAEQDPCSGCRRAPDRARWRSSMGTADRAVAVEHLDVGPPSPRVGSRPRSRRGRWSPRAPRSGRAPSGPRYRHVLGRTEGPPGATVVGSELERAQLGHGGQGASSCRQPAGTGAGRA